jgi:membrane protease YdiL (CAAX protease family)
VLALVVAASLTRRQPLAYYLAGSPVDGFWKAAEATAANAGASNPFILINPLHYFLVPLLVLIALGATARSLGLQMGYRSWVVGTAIGGLVLLLQITGGLSLAAIPGKVIVNLLQTGFSEEFLWRGAVQTRLHQLAGTEWALVLASVAFGLWHIFTNATLMGGGLLAGAAEGIIGQSAVGLALGFMFIRTGSLLAPSIVHIVIDL